jgi:hypothetical protein
MGERDSAGYGRTIWPLCRCLPARVEDARREVLTISGKWQRRIRRLRPIGICRSADCGVGGRIDPDGRARRADDDGISGVASHLLNPVDFAAARTDRA